MHVGECSFVQVGGMRGFSDMLVDDLVVRSLCDCRGVVKNYTSYLEIAVG